MAFLRGFRCKGHAVGSDSLFQILLLVRGMFFVEVGAARSMLFVEVGATCSMFLVEVGTACSSTGYWG